MLSKDPFRIPSLFQFSSSLLSALKYLTVSEQGSLQFYFSWGSTNNIVTQPIPCLSSRAPTVFYLLWNSQIPPHYSSLFLASLSFLGLPSLENASDILILDDLFWAFFFCPRFVIFLSDLLQFSLKCYRTQGFFFFFNVQLS